jgi:DNA uptake protein ComE-like DNA-binding protein
MEAREAELREESSRLEDELRLTSRQLEEAQDRAAAAERRLREVQVEARREIERERELRHREIEARLGEVAERATGAEERARVAEVSPDWTPPHGIQAVPSPQEPEMEPAEAAEQEAKEPSPDQPQPTSDLLNLNSANFEQLRELGMSITQAKRVIAYREHHDGFDSVDEMDEVPGFPRAFLVELKAKLTA